MKLFKEKNHQKGFTLVELVLVVGLIALMTIGIYLKYKSIYMDRSVQLQMQDLYAFNNKINGAYQSSSSLTTLNNTTAISGGLVPTELINAPNIINRFGSTITLSRQLVAGVEGYEILLNNITPKACSLIGTSKYANEVDEIWINGANNKTTGNSLTAANIATIVTQCNSATSIGFRNRMFYNTPPDSYTQKRPTQTNKYYIPTLNNTVTSASTACGSGGTWNGSFCSCPAGTEFDGAACTSNSTPLNCAYGTGTDQTTGACAALPPTKSQETFYNGTTMVTQSPPHYSATAPTTRATCTAANGYWDATTNICGGILPTQTTGSVSAPAPTYQGGRYLPQVMNTQVSSLTQDTNVRDGAGRCAATGGNWDGKICNYCPAPSTIVSTNTRIVNATTGTATVANLSSNPTAGIALAGHAATSTWNVDRCVTPAASAAPPYPQTVNW